MTIINCNMDARQLKYNPDKQSYILFSSKRKITPVSVSGTGGTFLIQNDWAGADLNRNRFLVSEMLWPVELPARACYNAREVIRAFLPGSVRIFYEKCRFGGTRAWSFRNSSSNVSSCPFHPKWMRLNTSRHFPEQNR